MVNQCHLSKIEMIKKIISNRRSNRNNNLAPSNNQNIMYGQNAPTGAQTKQKDNL